jgi:hypothetical protein
MDIKPAMFCPAAFMNHPKVTRLLLLKVAVDIAGSAGTLHQETLAIQLGKGKALVHVIWATNWRFWGTPFL